MKSLFILGLAAALCASPGAAQPSPKPHSSATDDYAADIVTVGESQKEALDQAKEMLKETENQAQRTALQTAIKDMESAGKTLDGAKNNPSILPSAVAAEQAAYQALLKLVPHEYRVNRSKRGSKGGGAGQPNPRQMDQLEMTSEENRYETERQATAPPNGQQREQLEMADRLKQLAQRQQDLNDRLRELQTALQQARTEKEQEEIRRELKHLADEERQMLSDVDELKQKLDQSPNSNSSNQAARDLEQTRSETQRAAQELGNQSVSEALAAGARAEQSMQNMRENLRNQASSQFSSDMRQLQNQARDLARQEDDIARSLSSLNNTDQKKLDNSQERQQLVQQMARQQSALTNLLGAMQEVTEKAETTEPLLSEQLYDALRRAGQMHTENLIETGGELVDRGFLTKAAEVEQSARTNINELRKSVEHAAESVLGSQSDALRYAENELKDLTKQVENGLGDSTNTSVTSANAATNAAQASTTKAGGSPAPGPGSNPEPGSEPTQTGGGVDQLRQLVQQSGSNRNAAGGANSATGTDSASPITGGGFANWADRMRDVEQVVDSVELRNRLATVRERVAAYRAQYRLHGDRPPAGELRFQVVQPMTQIGVELQEALARLENSRSLVPLDHDPVPETYSELVRKYYEKLGGGQ